MLDTQKKICACTILNSAKSAFCVNFDLIPPLRHFEVTGKDEDSYKIFAVPDFVGDACKAIASRVRGAVAGVQFDDFHKVRG